MKKILYLMHVHWDWIKQRPHFIAEGLSEYYNLNIVSPIYYSLRPSQLTNNSKNGLSFKHLIYFPFYDKSYVRYVNNLYFKLYVSYLIKSFDPDYLWITTPGLYEFVPANFKNNIIYDCMDDVIEFEENNKELFKLEKKLIEKSSLIFVSSNNLALKINKRLPNNKTFLIRNAFNGNIFQDNSSLKQNYFKKIYKIGYIGTVSSWFDFESLIFTLNSLKNIEYHIIGPIYDGINKIKHERIKFHGPIDHDKLFDYIKDFDCMIMPFKLNNLVISVDPVKFYEYINFNKPIISIFYEEIERFSQFADFYSNSNELLNVLKELINNNFAKKYSEKERIEFLKQNSWECRIKQIINILNEKKH